jgi:cyclohexanone monooxygenase
MVASLESGMSELPKDCLDVLIVGAGISGIGAAATLRKTLPHKRIAVLESRAQLGGTWDLFRYPGIRSDSDMYTLSFRDRPWRSERSIIDGQTILDYLRETAKETGVAPLIHYGIEVRAAHWSSATQCWTVEVHDRAAGITPELRCRFLHLCAGYYSYAEGHRPRFEGEESFSGQIVHPQFWPESLDYEGRNVVVIGSGATAVTLVPAMAERAKHVVMLQRSPSYIASQPAKDPLARVLDRWMPASLVYWLVRWKCILGSVLLYTLARRQPRPFRRRIIELAAAELPAGYDVKTHFAPDYNPWDQRLCAVPDGDLFKAISAGTVSVVTDHIDRFVPEGIRLQSGRTLDAQVIVTATGLKVQPMGGIRLHVDGQAVRLSDTMVYRGAMFSGVPNMIHTFGYTNASWTLRADLIAAYLCRLLRYMDRHGHGYAMAPRDPAVGEQAFIDFNSGYVLRALAQLPKQGDRFPWRIHQNYLRDLIITRYSRINDGTLKFFGAAA